MKARIVLSALAASFVAIASQAENAKFNTYAYDKPMEIGNYDVEIDLGPGVNFVKFMGRRLAVDRTEVKSGSSFRRLCARAGRLRTSRSRV